MEDGPIPPEKVSKEGGAGGSLLDFTVLIAMNKRWVNAADSDLFLNPPHDLSFITIKDVRSVYSIVDCACKRSSSWKRTR